MPRTRRQIDQVEPARNRPYDRSLRRQRHTNPPTPPITSARFDFPPPSRYGVRPPPSEDDDSTDIESEDEAMGSPAAIFLNSPDGEEDETQGDDDDDDATDASGDNDETDENLSFIVRDSQEVIATDEDTDENGGISPAPLASTPTPVEVINISDVAPPPDQIELIDVARQNDSDVYDGEMSPVEIIEPTDLTLKVSKPILKPVSCKLSLDETMSDERSACVICCENITSDGRHEIVVLTGCGHLFGKCCIMEWIKKGKRECPNCKKKTKPADVRKIYPATMPLVVVDNSETESLRKKVEVSCKSV